MTPNERAQQIVDGYFIGGLGDTLEQPNLTKGDLRHTINHALEEYASVIRLVIDHIDAGRVPEQEDVEEWRRLVGPAPAKVEAT